MINNDVELLLLQERMIYDMYGVTSSEDVYKLESNTTISTSLKSSPSYSDTVTSGVIEVNATKAYKPTNSKNYKTWQTRITSNTPFVQKGKNMHYTLEDFLNSGQETYRADQLEPEALKNATALVEKINSLGELIEYSGPITSGYRSPARQRQIYERRGETPKMGSKHLYGHALDIYDPNGELKEKILNASVLNRAKDLGLYFENFGDTPNWVHIQDDPPMRTGGQIWSADNLLEKL